MVEIMSLDLLDLTLIVSYGFDKHFPTWFWIMAFLSSLAANFSRQRKLKALENK